MKDLLLQACLFLGMTRLFAFLNRKKVIILAMHQVMEDNGEEPYQPLREFLTSRQFERYLAVFSRYYNFITLDEAVAMIQGTRPLKPYSMVITFDDGYRNNLTHALPVLKKFNAPATIFLTAGLIENRIPMWVDRLDYALIQYTGEPLVCELGGKTLTIGGTSREEKAASFQKFRRTAKKTDCDDNEFLRVMEQTASIMESQSGDCLSNIWESDGWSALLTWDEIKTESSPLVTYGGHTVNHIRLARVPKEQASEELLASRNLIERRTNRDIRHFAYLDGSFNDRVCELVRECGFVSAVTGIEGFNKIGDDVTKLKRIFVPLFSDEPDMLARVSGLLFFISAIKRMVT